MTHLDPILLEAMKAAMPPQRLTHAEREVLLNKILSLISTLHPDGLEACDILGQLCGCVIQKYDNQLVTEARIDDYCASLTKTFERAYEAA